MQFYSKQIIPTKSRDRSLAEDIYLSSDGKKAAYKYIYKLYSSLKSEANELLADPIYRLQVNYSNDKKVRFFTYLNYVIMATYLFVISLGSVNEYLEMISQAYENKCYEQGYSSWLFINYSDKWLGLGPVSYSIIYLIISLPLIYIIGLGDDYYKREYYFLKYERYKKLISAFSNGKHFKITWNHQEMYNKQRREYLQGLLCLIVSVIMSFTAKDMQSLVINSVSLQFITQIDEMIFRYILLHIYHKNISNLTPDGQYNDLYV